MSSPDLTEPNVKPICIRSSHWEGYVEGERFKMHTMRNRAATGLRYARHDGGSLQMAQGD